MTRDEREERGETYRGKLNSTVRTDGSRPSSGSFSDPAEVQAREAARRVACATLSLMLMRDDGWLRIVPSADGKTVYLKWKFIRGDHRGRYVMAVKDLWQWDEALSILAVKLQEVDEGKRKPVKDTMWDGYETYPNEAR
jgi:hypothetical protein